MTLSWRPITTASKKVVEEVVGDGWLPPINGSRFESSSAHSRKPCVSASAGLSGYPTHEAASRTQPALAHAGRLRGDDVLLADRLDGDPLSAKHRAPLRLVSPPSTAL